MRKGEDGRYTAGGFGRSEDHLVKQSDGKWLIKYPQAGSLHATEPPCTNVRTIERGSRPSVAKR